jgi:hypothetical protein
MATSRTAPGPARREGIPPRLLPILYFAAAHAAILTAFAAVAFDPSDVAGFFYHPRMVAIVHLITLGWITSSILGSLYVIGPMALRTYLPAGRTDYAAWFLVTVGILGMVTHLWIQEFGGMAWSAATVMLGILLAAARVLPPLASAPIPAALKAHFALAFLNVLLAASFGILLAFDKKYSFLPARGLGNVTAHAHLAALGWASMIVMGAGYRMLPMILPSAMPGGRSLYAGALLLEAGTLGLFVSLLTASRWAGAFALLALGGFACFLAHVVWMRRHLRPAPPGLPRPDYGVWHAMLALACLAAAGILGVILAFSPESEMTLRLAKVYGVFGLVGFLAQMVVGVEARVLPMFAGYHANRNACRTGPVTKPHEMPLRFLQPLIFGAWSAGVPLLAAGMYREETGTVAAAGFVLLAGAMLGTLNTARVLRHSFRSNP